MKKIRKIAVGIGAALPTFALAQAVQIDQGAISGANIDDPNAIIENVIGWILAVAAAIAVLFLVIGGIRYIISAGNPEQAGAAKKTILYAIIGLIIILLSYALVSLIVNGTITNILK